VAGDLDRAGVLFEYRRIGAQMRVAAIDSSSGIEVVVIVPAAATPLQMQALAMAKLRRRLERSAP
jgi:hypothetical protein